MPTNNCLSCQTNLKFEDKIFATFVTCSNTSCHYNRIDYPKDCCNNRILKLTRQYKDFDEGMMDSDKYIVVNQCQTCGRKVGTPLKREQYNKSDLPHFDNKLLATGEEQRTLLRSEIEDLNKWRLEYKRQKFWDDYDEYLNTDRWKKIREIVLERDKHVCQSCLNVPATEVHHTAGQFRKNEPIFSLVSVCIQCHEIITEIERGNPANAKTITYSFDKE